MKALAIYLDNAHGAWIQLVNNAMALIGQLERRGIEVDTLVELRFGPAFTAKTHISGKKQGDFDSSGEADPSKARLNARDTVRLLVFP